MSLRTTTTASFVLTKYSRSYGTLSSAQGQPASASENEWRHFTNPVIKLLLDAQKSLSGELSSLRLRILWSLDMQGADMDIDQREVVFEDLELLSFSSLPMFRAANNPDHGLPLKVVYRDAVVGIRYLHPKTVPAGSPPVYRRFQMTFSNAAEASRFVDAIRPVCPCKASPQPNQINHNMTMLPGNTLVRTSTTIPDPYMRPEYPLPPSGTPVAAYDHQKAPTVVSRPWRSDVSTTSVTPTLSSEDSGIVTCPETRRISNIPGNQPKVVPSSSSSSLPSSSQPYSSSYTGNMMPPPPVPCSAPRPADVSAFVVAPTKHTDISQSKLLASLSDFQSLYNLSRSELECLLDNLDLLWRTKGFLSR
ncbi:hypothetical protein ID866_3518 [Astraeus odoratus]|nr:hypothetical protein ID866_3518 [Astraeus odoratus]